MELTIAQREPFAKFICQFAAIDAPKLGDNPQVLVQHGFKVAIHGGS